MFYIQETQTLNLLINWSKIKSKIFPFVHENDLKFVLRYLGTYT